MPRKSASLCVLFLIAHHAGAQPPSYAVSHTFTFDPAGDVAEVRYFEFRHAWIRSLWGDNEGHEPQAQDPGFDPYGTDAPGWPSWINTGMPGPVPVQYGSGLIDAATGSNPSWFCVDVPAGPSHARACNRVDVPAWTQQTPLSIPATIESAGYADAVTIGSGASFAYAASTAGLTARGGFQMASGQVQWIPGFQVQQVGGQATDLAVQDPIVFTATNLITGDVIEWRLLDILAFSGAGVGTVEWQAGVLTVDRPEFEITIEIPAGVVDPTQTGSMRLEVAGGAVIASTGSGVFAGSVVPLGLATPFSVPMPSLSLNYDLGLDPTQPWSVVATFCGGGSVSSASGTGCAADLAEPFGVLNFFDIAAYINAYIDGDPSADLTEPFGVFNFLDISAYINLYNAGCMPGTDG
ncbi:MAG: hypothetical protein D6692_11385 [Planctomycetota bacterium]|nr:MAG: hypothetical protein D6692_11385 [Planctomycetota bacterium]